MLPEVVLIGSAGGLHCSTYSLLMGLAALCGILVTLILGRKEPGRAVRVSVSAAVGALIGGHLLWCLCCLDRLPDYAGGISILWQPWLGGYCLAGALLGGTTAILLAGLPSHAPLKADTELAVPGVLIALCIARAAECVSGQGLSNALFDSFAEDELSGAFVGFPFTIAVSDPEWPEYITWHIPVFFYEALVALILFIAALILRRCDKKPPLTGTMLTLLSASQILLEQLRADDCIRFGFIRFTQVAAILAMLGVMICRMVRHRQHISACACALRSIVLCMCALVIVLCEFALQKPLTLPWLRLSILACAALGCCAMLDHTRRMQRLPIPVIIISVVLMLAVIALVILLQQVSDSQPIMIYTVMALALAGAAADVLAGYEEIA